MCVRGRCESMKGRWERGRTVGDERIWGSMSMTMTQYGHELACVTR